MKTEIKKLLNIAKDNVAKINGYADWFQIDMTDTEQWERDEIKANMIDEIAIEYGKLLIEPQSLEQPQQQGLTEEEVIIIIKNELGLDRQFDFITDFRDRDMKNIAKTIAYKFKGNDKQPRLELPSVDKVILAMYDTVPITKDQHIQRGIEISAVLKAYKCMRDLIQSQLTTKEDKLEGVNKEISDECIGLYHKEYDDEETGIHFKQRMKFLVDKYNFKNQNSKKEDNS